MKNIDILLDVCEYTNQAMLYELFTYPCFGLVSPYSSGSHKDMNYYTYIDSISVLNKYMFKFAYLGYSNIPITDMYNEAVKIGLDCEKEMFKKTNGVNTHKGLIFVLGTLVCSTTKTLYENEPFDNIFNNCKLLIKEKLNDFKNLNTDNLSNGEKIYLQYKVEGVRKEACLGFPIIKQALKFVNLNDKESLVKTLIYIMSVCEDTTIIYRKGIDELENVKLKMEKLLEKGFDKEELNKINNEFITKGISPGGSADLLCGTIFLTLIKNKFK